MQIAHIFAANSAVGHSADTCLVQVSEILCSKASDQTPKQCLQLYNCTFVLHQLHCELLGKTSAGAYFHALFIHSPVQHEHLVVRLQMWRVKKAFSKVLMALQCAAMNTFTKREFG